MAACNFLIPFSGSANEIFGKVKTAIQGQGGQFNGNDTGGSFDVSVFGNSIKGSYTVAGQDLDIIVDSKPFLIPCSTIESFLKSKLS
ncbi:MAG: hypothetical protein ABIR81_05085 [Ginsengibacter sp.]